MVNESSLISLVSFSIYPYKDNEIFLVLEDLKMSVISQIRKDWNGAKSILTPKLFGYVFGKSKLTPVHPDENTVDFAEQSNEKYQKNLLRLDTLRGSIFYPTALYVANHRVVATIHNAFTGGHKGLAIGVAVGQTLFDLYLARRALQVAGCAGKHVQNLEAMYGEQPKKPPRRKGSSNVFFSALNG